MSDEKTFDYLKRLQNEPDFVYHLQPHRKSIFYTMPSVSFVSNVNRSQNNDFASVPNYTYPYEAVCTSCGLLTMLNRTPPDEFICSSCTQIQTQKDLKFLAEIKFKLEDDISHLNEYLSLKRRQCKENIDSSREIRHFINLTMAQIKRKIELELETKRDELLKTIDSFVETQKKINLSISSDGFTGTQRLCEEINNVLLMSKDSINNLKINNLKILANKEVEKMNKFKKAKIPLYNIFFVPDSSIQIHNSFGKIVLKSYQNESYEDDPQLVSESTIRKNSKINKWHSTDALNFDYDFKSLSNDPKEFVKQKSQENCTDSLSTNVENTNKKVFISRTSPFRLKIRNQSQPAVVKRDQVKSEIFLDTLLTEASCSTTKRDDPDQEVNEYFSNFKSFSKKDSQEDDTNKDTAPITKIKISSL